YEAGHRRELVAAAGVDLEDERVHALPPGRSQRVPERAGVALRKPAVARSIEAGTLGRGQDGADGHHAGETLAWTHQPRLKLRRHQARTPRAASAPPQPPVNARPSRNGCGVTSPHSRASATRAPPPSGIPPPTPPPPRHRHARDYIASELSTLGLSVDLAPFSFRGRTYHNVVGATTGTDPRGPRLLLGAHFDSTAHTPGADDNASG